MMTLWHASYPLVLASRSAARRRMLEAAGIPLAQAPADLDERALEREAGRLMPSEIAALLARAKAHAAAPGSDALVLGADQTLTCDGRVFSKPESVTDAREQLLALRGRTHALHAAVAVVAGGQLVFEHVETARLTVREFTADFLDRYLEAAGPAVRDSVGAYQLEALGSHLFSRIEGDYFTILGLPLLPLLAFLRRHGALAS